MWCGRDIGVQETRGLGVRVLRSWVDGVYGRGIWEAMRTFRPANSR